LVHDRYRGGGVLLQLKGAHGVCMAAQGPELDLVVVHFVFGSQPNPDDHGDDVVVSPKKLGAPIRNPERHRVQPPSDRIDRHARPMDAFRNSRVAGELAIAARRTVRSRQDI